MPPNDPLFTSFELGDTVLRNRIVMASMTRGRATNPELIPTDLHVKYYRQRASAGLIMAEATWISEEAIGAINVPGLYAEEQVAAWKHVTDAVHAQGGTIIAQIGHSGAVSHPDLLHGALPIAPSAVNVGLQAFTLRGFQPTPVPRAMTQDDIARTIADYARAAANAKRAGFDGVELHASTTYLLPQFLNSGLNQRTDRYGGTPENRTRIVIEILRVMSDAWPGGKIGIKINPAISMGRVVPTDETVATYDCLIEQLNDFDLSHLQVVRALPGVTVPSCIAPITDTIGYYRARYNGRLIANGGYDAVEAATELSRGRADLVAFAKPFIGNPDLVMRFAEDRQLSSSDPATWYQGGAGGYVDYRSCAHRAPVDA